MIPCVNEWQISCTPESSKMSTITAEPRPNRRISMTNPIPIAGQVIGNGCVSIAAWEAKGNNHNNADNMATCCAEITKLNNYNSI